MSRTLSPFPPPPSNPTPAALEAYKAALQIHVEEYRSLTTNNLEEWKSQREHERIMFRGIIDFALAAIKLLALANGGAIVASMSFLGNIAVKETGKGGLVTAAAPSIKLFVIGLAAALFAAGIAYVSQVLFSELQKIRNKKIWGNIFRGGGLAAAALSLVMFCWGAWAAANALANYSVPAQPALPT